MAQKIRTIIESDAFVETRLALQGSAKRVDEILGGSHHALARRPSYFPRVPGTTVLHSLRTEEFPPHIPSYLIWFRFDDQEVVLEELSFAFPEDADQLPNPHQD
jgi:hypothetical protein